MNIQPIETKGYRDGLAGLQPCPNVLASAYPEVVAAYLAAHAQGLRERSLSRE